MRLARLKGEGLSYYHCMSRVVDGRFIFKTVDGNSLEAERFVELMRRQEAFCGVRIVTYALMSNHFHILVEVPERKDLTEEEILNRIECFDGPEKRRDVAWEFEHYRSTVKAPDLVEALRQKYLARMFDVSIFIKELKGRFAQWYNRRNDRYGVLWADRFKSVLVEGPGETLLTMAAYIDLNPVRAGLVADPKDYRYCGYGEAVGGNRSRAKEGLCCALEGADWDALSREYRKLLFGVGEKAEILANERPGGEKAAKRGIEAEKVEEVTRQGGGLTLSELLRCRVRYFTDGVVLGQKAFVEEQYSRIKDRLGAKRKSGARKMRGGEWAGLCVLRDLRVRAVG